MKISQVICSILVKRQKIQTTLILNLSSEIFSFVIIHEKINYCAEIHRQLAGYYIIFNRFI